jgi:hypothetical protein
MKQYSNNELFSLILLKQYKTGVFFNTYLQEYRLIRSYKEAKTIIFRTTKKYFEKCKNKTGLSLFRISSYKRVSLIPLPAGFNFIGNPTLGRWKKIQNGDKKWSFYTAYKKFYSKNLPKSSKLYQFSFYKKILLATTSPQAKSFFQKKENKHNKPTANPKANNLKQFLQKYFQLTLFSPTEG